MEGRKSRGKKQSLSLVNHAKAWLKVARDPKHHVWWSVGVYMLAWFVASWVFYLRFPNAWHQPNFYAEDGIVFARNLLQHGFYHAIGSSFNGYYLWAVYLLEQVGVTLNTLFFHGEFVNLARTFALVSYAAFGFVATLPILLFRGRLRPIALILATLLLVFVPMPGSDYAIIGVVSDIKFGFVFVAFCLLMYRHMAKEDSRLIYLVDLGLLISAYTNTTVYLLLPFALLRYWPKLKTTDRWRKLWADPSFRSLIVLGIALLPQLFFLKRDGVPPMPGYLDSPYKSASTIELFFGRSFVFGFLAPIYKSLTNAWVLFIMVISTGLGSYFSGAKYRKYFIFGWLSVVITSLLFVIKRPGVSEFHIGYHSGGFDQFFYAQNWIFNFVLAIAVVELISKFKWLAVRVALYGLIGWYFVAALIPLAGSYGETDTMQKNVGNIYAVSQEACRSKDQNLTIPVYPTPDQKYTNIPHQQLCTVSALNYRPSNYTVDLGLLPTSGKYFESLGIGNFFTQSFVASEPDLNGLTVYFSTFGQKVKSPYNLTLFQADCKTQILSVGIRTGRIKDNSFFEVPFPTVKDSDDKTYCFSVASTRRNEVSHLAVQLSPPDVYPEGVATINGEASKQDIVFKPHYR